MKVLNRTISAGLAAMMLLSAVIPASADETSSKEEVIYVMSDADGSVDGVYAVNIFGKGSVTDFGDYTDVKMLNTNDKVTVEGDKITFSTDSDKAYCQGTLQNAEIPWNISIEYFLDGEEMTAKQIAGKSGSLEIKFKIGKNEKCSTDFYDSFALQASFALDTAICTDIKADGATMANVGGSKQISYTVLPGKGLDASVTAQVKDFEMSEISINGVRMNLDIEVDDSEITDKVTELSEGVEKLDDGAKELSDGTAELKDGAGELKNGTDRLTDGAGDLKSGAADLKKGAGELKNGAGEVNDGVSSLSGGADEVNSGAVSLEEGAGQLKNGAQSLKDGSSQLSDGSQSMDGGVAKLSSGIVSLQNGLDELNAQSENLTTGSAQVKSALEQIQSSLDSVSADTENIRRLTAASGEIKTAISDLKNGAEQLRNNLGYAQYKGAMSANGLDIDQLAAGNTQAIQSLSAQIGQLNASLAQIQDVPGYETQAAQLQGQISQLTQIVTLLKGNNGAIAGTEQYLGSLSEGVEQLYWGLEQLEASYGEFDISVNTLADTLTSMLVDLSRLSDGINTLTRQYSALDEGINSYTDGVGQIVDGYSQLTSGISELAAGSKSLVEGSRALDGGVSDLYDGIAQLYDGAGDLSGGTKELAYGAGKLSSGAKELYNGASELLDGTNELSEGAGKLSDGTKELSDGASELYDGADKLSGGASELSDGTGELRDKTTGMDKEIEEKIDDVISSIRGSDSETVSFISEKNTDVESVQFVIKTEAVEIPQQETEEQQEEEQLSFWQKLLRLFGLY